MNNTSQQDDRPMLNPDNLKGIQSSNIDDEPEPKIKGVIFFNEEPSSLIFAKWIAWITIMCLIVVVFIWYGFYFDQYECDLTRSDIQKSNKRMGRRMYNHMYKLM